MLERWWETTDQTLGQTELVGGRPPHRVGQSLTEAKLAHLWWVTSFGLLEWAYVVLFTEMTGFDLGLSLFSSILGPDSTSKVAFPPWACVERL